MSKDNKTPETPKHQKPAKKKATPSKSKIDQDLMYMDHGIEASYVQAGHVNLFEDYVNSGPMWAGYGKRSVKKKVTFNRPFISRPVIHLNISLLDVRTEFMIRYDLKAKNITTDDFDIQFDTWDDSKFARVNVSWMAIGNNIRDEYWVNF